MTCAIGRCPYQEHPCWQRSRAGTCLSANPQEICPYRNVENARMTDPWQSGPVTRIRDRR